MLFYTLILTYFNPIEFQEQFQYCWTSPLYQSTASCVQCKLSLTLFVFVLQYRLWLSFPWIAIWYILIKKYNTIMKFLILNLYVSVCPLPFALSTNNWPETTWTSLPCGLVVWYHLWYCFHNLGNYNQALELFASYNEIVFISRQSTTIQLECVT
jgi:hypothetical protein